jgi:hypothetical protein
VDSILNVQKNSYENNFTIGNRVVTHNRGSKLGTGDIIDECDPASYLRSGDKLQRWIFGECYVSAANANSVY